MNKIGLQTKNNQLSMTFTTFWVVSCKSCILKLLTVLVRDHNLYFNQILKKGFNLSAKSCQSTYIMKYHR